MNPPGEPSFLAAPGTPSVNGLGTLIDGQPDGVLLTDNPNAQNPANGANAINPFRLDRSQASTCDQDHNYGDEQKAFDQGLMDLFPASCRRREQQFCSAAFAYGKGKGLVMGYFDGNTVTALWNYAQNFAMNDNSYGTTFGPSTPGLAQPGGRQHLSGDTERVVVQSGVRSYWTPAALVGDLDPTGDVCSAGTTVQLGGQNIGDLAERKGRELGRVHGRLRPERHEPERDHRRCNRQSPATPRNGGPTKDYIPHHAFFQYYASTANPQHTAA